MANDVSAVWRPDGVLLEAASRVLAEAGYSVQYVRLDAVSEEVLVADDAYSALCIVTSSDWSSISGQIDTLQLSFGNWAVHKWGAEKRWDLYLAVLVSADLDPDELGDVELVVSDIKYVRKIVRGSVTASFAGVSAALAPFLPVALVTATGLADPLADLEIELRRLGIEPAAASFAVESFRRSGEVSLP